MWGLPNVTVFPPAEQSLVVVIGSSTEARDFTRDLVFFNTYKVDSNINVAKM